LKPFFRFPCELFALSLSGCKYTTLFLSGKQKIKKYFSFFPALFSAPKGGQNYMLFPFPANKKLYFFKELFPPSFSPQHPLLSGCKYRKVFFPRKSPARIFLVFFHV